MEVPQFSEVLEARIAKASILEVEFLKAALEALQDEQAQLRRYNSGSVFSNRASSSNAQSPHLRHR